MTRARAAVGALLPVVLAGLLAGCSNDTPSGSGDQGYVAGKGIITSVQAADRKRPGEVAGTSLDDKPISLSDYRGKTVVVNVWGSWCPPCNAEAPMLTKAAKEYAAKGDDVVFLGIDSRDPSRAAARAFQRRYAVPYPSIYDQRGTTLLAFRGTLSANSIPSTIVVDPQGRVSGSVLGSITRGTLDGLVEDAASGGGA